MKPLRQEEDVDAFDGGTSPRARLPRPATARKDDSGTVRYAASEGVLSPRLLILEEAAAYLGVSPWTVRDLEAAGTIRRVRVPLPGGRELRRLLFDKTELDRLIERWKG